METTKSPLAELCRQITSQESNILPHDHRIGPRLVCPEYSHSVQEVKTYPLLQDERIFALCWNITANTAMHATMHTTIHATMCPAPQHFCYQHTFPSGSLTQLHTHDYIELAYVVDGTFRQKILGNDIIFQKGELCLIDKNCLHQDYLLDEPAVVLFLGIANDMFSEIMDENITTQKIISFLQSALLKQKDVQQYLHFKPIANVKQEIEDCLWLLLKELYENNVGSRYICKGLLLRIFRIMSTKYEFSLSKEQRKTMNWIILKKSQRIFRNILRMLPFKIW